MRNKKMMSAKEMNIIAIRAREEAIEAINKEIDAFITNGVEKYILEEAKKGLTGVSLPHNFGPHAAEILAEKIRSYGYLVKLLPHKMIRIGW